MESKDDYFEYFPNHKNIKKIIKTTESRQELARPKTSQYQLAQLQKLLPHITEQYQYRITNQLLQHKINHPRRDKIIVESVQSAGNSRESPCRKNRRLKSKERSRENMCHSRQQSETEEGVPLQKDAKEQGQASLLSKKGQIQRLYKTFGDINSTCNNYKNDYLISLENTRMGKRLINTRSMVSDILTKTYYTYQLYNGKLANKDKFMSINRNSAKFRKDNRNFGKINNGIKSFFHNSYSQHHQASEGNNSTNDQEVENPLNKTMILEDKSLNKLYRDEGQTCSTNSHAYQTKNPLILQTYGTGDYTFIINRLIIKSNPPLKPESLLVLQLIERGDSLANISNSYYAERNNYCKQYCQTEVKDQKGYYTSSSFTYDYISGQSEKSYGIKFKIHRLREFYIRILRNEGIQQRQIGIFKINLMSYFTREKGEFPFAFYLEQKQFQGVVKQREIFESKFEGNLIKWKVGETNNEIKVQYLFYNRYFKPINRSEQRLKSTLQSTKSEQ